MQMETPMQTDWFSPLGPDGARWGFPTRGPAGAAAPPPTSEREIQTQQLEAEIEEVARDVDEVVDTMEVEQMKERVGECLLQWAAAHDAEAERLLLGGAGGRGSSIPLEQAAAAAEDRRWRALELREVREAFLMATDEEEMLELNRRAASLHPDRAPAPGALLPLRPDEEDASGARLAAEPLTATGAEGDSPATRSPASGTCAAATTGVAEADITQSPAPAAPAAPAAAAAQPQVGLREELLGLKRRLAAALVAEEGGDKASLLASLQELEGLRLQWAPVKEAAIGKELGLCAKHPDQEVATRARGLVAKLHKLAQKQGASYAR